MNLPPDSHYAVLGVAQDATDDEIRKGWRRLARNTHPDREGATEEDRLRFERGKVAVDALLDPEHRARHDRRLRERRVMLDILAQAPNQPPAGGWRRHLGGNVRLVLPLTPAEIIGGTTRRVELARLDGCPGCGGGGRDAAREICAGCGGTGLVPGGVTVSLRIQPSVRAGEVLQYQGIGSAGVGGGARGDALVTVAISTPPGVRVHGLNVYQCVALTPLQAARGLRLHVRLPDGRDIVVPLPAGVLSGTTFCLPSSGLPASDGRRGDYLLRVGVWVPALPYANPANPWPETAPPAEAAEQMLDAWLREPRLLEGWVLDDGAAATVAAGAEDEGEEASPS